MSLDGSRFEVVKQYKYLGNIISHDLDDEYDVKYKLNCFYSSSNSTFRSFSGVSLETIVHLFNAYCIPQYGLSLWNSYNIFNKQYFRRFEIAISLMLRKNSQLFGISNIFNSVFCDDIFIFRRFF